MSGKRVKDVFHPYAGSKTVTIRFEDGTEKTVTEGKIQDIQYTGRTFNQIRYVIIDDVLYSQWGIVSFSYYKKSRQIMDKRTNAYEMLKEVRNEHELQKFFDYLYQDSNSDIVQVMKVHENVWNRMFVLHHTNEMSGSTLNFGGIVTLEIEHARGILILINDSYHR